MIILIFLLLWAGRVVGGLAVDDDQLLVVVHMRAPAANVIAVGEEPWPEKKQSISEDSFWGKIRLRKVSRFVV